MISVQKASDEVDVSKVVKCPSANLFHKYDCPAPLVASSSQSPTFHTHSFELISNIDRDAVRLFSSI